MLRHAVIAAVSALLLSSCYEGQLSQGVVLTCTPGMARLCPRAHTCSPFGRCASSESVLSGATVTPAFARDGVTLVARFIANGLSATPTVTLADENGRTLAELQPNGSVSPPDYQFERVVSAAALREGRALVLADVTVGGAVSLAHVVGEVTLDFTPPRLTNQLTFTPAPTNPLRTVTAMGPGTTLGVYAVANETLFGAGEAQLLPCGAGSPTLLFGPGTGGELDRTFAGTLPQSVTPPQGCHAVEVTVSDLAGNVSRTDAGAIDVDTLAPGEPNVDPGHVVYRREPGDAGWLLSVRATGGVGPGELLVLTAPLNPDLALAVARADSSGSVAAGQLTLVSAQDVPIVAVAAADGAGNRSARVRVSDVEWVGIGGVSPELRVFRRSHDGPALRYAGEPDVLAPAPGAQLPPIEPRASWKKRFSDQQDFGAPNVSLAAMACDGEGRECLLFGGVLADGLTLSQNTWRWNGDSWVQERGLLTVPVARRYAAMAFDPIRRVYVLIGGLSSSGTLSDIWEWDPQVRRWTQWAEPLGRPIASHAMSYDLARRRLQLNGGVERSDAGVSSPAALTSMWEWDGHTWSETPGPAGAEARVNHSMVYDPNRRETLVLGGRRFGSPDPELAAFDGIGWRVPGQPPPGRRSMHAAVYEPATRTMFVFRGTCAACTPCAAYDTVQQVWSVAPFNCSALVAAASGPWAAAFAEPQGLVVNEAATTGEIATWLLPLDGGTQPRPLARQSLNPLARWHHTLTSIDGGALLAGGTIGQGNLVNGALLLDGAGWATIPVLPTPLELHATVDTAAGPLVLGGSDGVHIDAGTALLLQSGAWQPFPQPPFFVIGHVAGVRPNGDVLLFSGGRGTMSGWIPQLGTWLFTSGSWVDVSPTLGAVPPVRMLSAMTRLTDGELLLLGGLNSAATDVLDDSWTFSDAGWVPQLSPRPPGRMSTAIALDGWGTPVLFGGRARSGDLDDTWELLDGGWSPVVITDPDGDGQPVRRESHAMAGQPGGDVVLFGGGIADRELYSDTWELKRSEAAAVLHFSAETVGIEAAAEISSLQVELAAGASTPGVSASLWHDGAFEVQASDDTATLAAMKPLSFSTASAGVLRGLSLGGDIAVIVRPRAKYPVRASVGLGASRVEVHYRLPFKEPSP